MTSDKAFCLAPISVGLSKLTKNGFLSPFSGFFYKVTASGMKLSVEDVTSNMQQDLGRRKIAVQMPAKSCDDLQDCIDLCTDSSTAKEPIQLQPVKEFESTCISTKKMKFNQRQFTHLIECDTNENTWMNALSAEFKTWYNKINKRMIEELEAHTGAYGDGSTTATPKQLTLFNPSTGALNPLGYSSLMHEYTKAGYSVMPGDIVVLGDQLATVAGITAPLSVSNQGTGLNAGGARNLLDIQYDGWVTSVTGNANYFYTFAKDSIKFLFFSKNKEVNNALGGSSDIQGITSLKSVFTGKLTGQGAQQAGRVDTTILIPITDPFTGATIGVFPADLSAYYDNKCDTWYAVFSTNYVVISDLQVDCNNNGFNGIMKFKHCEFVEATCPTGMTQPTPVTPTLLSVPTLTGTPITVTSIQLKNDDAELNIQTASTSIANNAALTNLLSYVSGYGATFASGTLKFPTGTWTHISFNGGAWIALT